MNESIKISESLEARVIRNTDGKIGRDPNNNLVFGNKEPKYFDYRWDAAREYAGVDKCSDLRICKSPQTFRNWPRKGQFALWGILPEEQK